MVMHAQHSPLVAGSPTRPGADQWVRVVRAFMLSGQGQAAGGVLKLRRALADELRAGGKVSFCDAPAPVVDESPRPATKTARRAESGD